MRRYLTEAIKDYKITLSDEQLAQLEKYFELLCEWNEKINLTAITDPKGVAVKHFADSLSIFNYIDVPQNARVIDVGTGAGFPAVVLKIARPDIQLTLLDRIWNSEKASTSLFRAPWRSLIFSANTVYLT